jgi:hypothetical protein
MNLQDLTLLRNIVTATPQQREALNIQCFTFTRNGKPYQRTDDRVMQDFIVDVEWAMRNHKTDEWRGYITHPTTCTNPECPFYTGRTISLTYSWKGDDDRPTWYWDAQQGEGIESGCGDHSWLTDNLKVKRAE